MADKDLFGDIPLPDPPARKAFDGTTYDPERDHQRLKGLLGRVYRLMSDHEWHTLAQISKDTGGTEASVSARLRDFRKDKYGSMEIERRGYGSGLFKYRMTGRTQSRP